MIWLPEIETLRRDLEREFAGKRVKGVEIHVGRVVGGTNQKKVVAEKLEGAKIARIGRRGLHLVFELDSDDVVVVWLGQSGQLRKNAPKDEVLKRTAVVISFTQGGQLRLVDPGAEATLTVVGSDQLGESFPELADLGIDPVEEPLSWTTFAAVLLEQDRPLSDIMSDQTVLVGLGDVYVDEILFNAGLRHERTTRSLSSQEIRRLYRGVVEVLHDAVKYRGVTLDDGGFVDLFGEPGGFGEHLQVYGREGELSPRTRRPIVKAKRNGRWVYFCETSQV